MLCHLTNVLNEFTLISNQFYQLTRSSVTFQTLDWNQLQRQHKIIMSTLMHKSVRANVNINFAKKKKIIFYKFDQHNFPI